LRRVILIFACIASALGSVGGAGCKDGGASPDSGPSDGRVDRPIWDLGPYDAGTDAVDGRKCDPNCHWDCFDNGTVCSKGKVYYYGSGAEWCCTYSDPWPYNGPECTDGMVQHSCLVGCRKFTDVDKRYQHCLAPSQKYGHYPKDFAHLLKLHCSHIEPVKPGTTCALDEDCRPAAPGVERLACDWETQTCVAIEKKAAPSYLGQDCGLSASSGTSKYTVDVAATGKSCTLCHVVWDAKQQCLLQGCTVACKYDDDCPQGMVCLCARSATGSTMRQICAAATDRLTVQGRTAGLKCHDQAADAGTAAGDAGP
jgi:hypothetical protein